MIQVDKKTFLLDLAKKAYEKGPGFAQEGVVLAEARDELNLQDLAGQQELLTEWHELFSEGKLSWGYDIDNPNSPFFHVTSKK